MRGRLGGFQRHLLATLLALGGVSLLSVCADVNAPGHEQRGQVAFAPTLSSAAASALGASSTVVDNVHIVIRTLDGTIVFDRVVVFPDGADEVSIAADIPVHGESERFQATIQLRSGDVVLFEGTQDLDVLPGQQSGPPASVPVTYVGTGANAASVGVAPGTLELSANGSAPLVATVRDGAGNVIQNVPLGWTSSNEDVATVSDNGVVTAKALRGTATITASTFGGVAGTSSARVTLPPSQLRVASGGAQTGRVGEALSLPFVVELLASDGVGVANATISFSTNNPGASISPATATTDANGRASASITLGTVAGPQSFSASSGSFSANTSATALAGEANRIAVASGDAQSGLTGAALTSPLTVKVTDEFGNPGAGRQVSWAAIAGGTLGAATTTTNAAGIATNTFTLPVTAGPASIQAVLSIGGSVVFTATALPRPASSLSVISGTPQTGSVGTAAQSLVLRAFDALNQPVANAVVTWSVTGTATIGATTSTTNAIGFATIAANFGPTVGASTVTATVSGAANVTFALTAVAGAPAAIELFAGEGQSAGSGIAVPIAPAVRVVDAFGNPVPGVAVTFGGATLGGSVTGPNQVTDASGIATVGSWTLGGFGAAQTMTATAGLLTATFHATATATPILHLVFVSGNGQSATIGTPLPAPMIVDVRDTSNTPIPGVSVQFTMTLGGGTPASQTIISDANGRAAFSFTLGPTIGTQSVTACIVPGCTSVLAFNATGTAAGSTRTWTGATTNNWTVAANWSPAIVPTALDDVVIPSGTPNSPFLFGAVTINKLAVAPSVTLNLNGFQLTVAGDVNATGATIVGGNVRLTGAANTLAGTVPSLIIDAGAVITTAGTVTVNGTLIIQSASTFDVGGNVVTVSGTFDVVGAGSHLKTTNAGGALVLNSTATFNGADMAGVDLTAGLLDLKGNFIAGNTNGSQAFHAAGSHLTRFSGTGAQSITFNAPGAGSSTFANVAITNLSGAGVFVSASNAFVSGALNQDGRLTVASPRTLTIAGALTLGTASTTTVAGGASISAASCTPLGGASFSGFSCGSSVATWLGGAGNDWNTPANWSTGAVPIATTDVVVPSGTPNSVVLPANVTAKNFTVASGASMNMGIATIFIGGNVSTTGAIFIGTGSFNMSGASVTLAGNVPNLTISGITALSGTTTVTGNVTIAGGGVLGIGANTMTIGANLFVNPINGRLKMTNAAGVLTVNGTATFDGSEMGDLDLTAGLLDLKGDFVATATEFQSFRAAGTHITRFSGTGAQSISMAFASNTQSRFQELQIQNSSGAGVTLSTNVYVAGNVAQNGRASLGTSLLWSIAGTLTLGPTSNTTVTGGSIVAGSCTPISGEFHSGFVCGGPVTTWLGGTSSNWFLGANWSTGNVPNGSTNVVVPASTPNSIVVTGNVVANDFTLNAGATLATGGFELQFGRNVNIQGTLTGGGPMRLFPVAGTLDGTIPMNVEIGGNVTVGSSLIVNGNVLIQGGGMLTINTDAVTINGTLDLFGAARLRMTDADGSLTVSGDATFNGQDMGDLDLVAGTLELKSNFSAGAFSSQSFRAAGNHITLFSGTGAQSISMFSPGPANSRFNNLHIANTSGAGVSLTSSNYVAGNVTQIGRLTVPSPQALTIAGSIDLFSGSTTTVTGAISYGSCNDGGGATIVGFTCTPALVWNGSISTNWDLPSNWTPAQAPAGQSIVIPSGTPNIPFLQSNTVINNLTLNSGATLDRNSFDLTVQGSLSAAAGSTISAVGNLRMSGVGKTLAGAIPNLIVDPGASILATAPVTIAGGLAVSSGTFDVGSTTVTVGSALTTAGSAHIKMNNPGALLSVGGNAVFGGLDMGDLDLTAGILDLKGTFLATSASVQSFRAAGTHTTRFSGVVLQTIDFNTAGAAQSRFQNLEITNTGINGVTIQSTNAHVQGTTRQAGLLNVPAARTLFITGLLTLETGSTTNVFGTLTPAGGCVHNGGTFAGFTC